jgi:hypothetical protein
MGGVLHIWGFIMIIISSSSVVIIFLTLHILRICIYPRSCGTHYGCYLRLIPYFFPGVVTLGYPPSPSSLNQCYKPPPRFFDLMNSNSL